MAILIIKYELLTDEDLIERYRKGEDKARDTLSVRYFRLRNSIWRAAFPEALLILDEWEANETFFSAYLMAEGNYEGDKDTKFLTFFCCVLRYCAISAIREHMKEPHFLNAISLDDYSGDDDGSEGLTNHEVIADKGEESPVSYVNYQELTDAIKVVRPGDAKKWSEVVFVSLSGLGVKKSSELFDEDPVKVRRKVAEGKEDLREWVAQQEKTIDPKKLISDIRKFLAEEKSNKK